jgi:hypothetical protein
MRPLTEFDIQANPASTCVCTGTTDRDMLTRGGRLQALQLQVRPLDVDTFGFPAASAVFET